MKIWHLLTLLGWCAALGTGLAEEAAKSEEAPLFPDTALEKVVRQQVFAKRYTTEPLTAEDVARIAVLNGNFRGIQNLSGLEHCKALASVDLAGNQIMELSPLNGLRQLQFVNLASNRVHDIAPLGTLRALQYIQLEHNAVSDLSPLAACTNLASVYVSHNKVHSLAPVTQLPRIVTLYADGNQLLDLEGVEKLRGLTSLSVGNNHIADLSPLSGLRAPSFLRFSTNRVSDLKPFYQAAVADLEGSKNWAPFVRVYLEGNPLSANSVKLREEMVGKGIRLLH
jgi:Leucine-rich repeat (LRR) protein